MQENFEAAFQDLHLLKHPFYQAWMEGKLSRTQLQDYAHQYMFHVERFPRYLSAIHSQCENPAWRKDLLENLNDEEGLTHGKSHPQLWSQFAEGVGSAITNPAPRAAIQNVAETFFSAARSSFHEGLGALYAYECQVPEIATSKIAGLKEHYGVESEEALEFFAVHEKADVEHRKTIARILDGLPANERAEAQISARKAAQSLWDFLSDV